MGEIVKKSMNEVIDVAQERFNKTAPKHMQYEVEKGYAIQLLKNSDYLMRAAKEAPESLQQAITNIAAIGLSLNPAEKLAYLMPRNVKTGRKVNGKDEYQTRIFLEPSYIGLIRLATDSGSIEWCQAVPVYANDDFIDNGPGEKITHIYKAFAKPEERGKFVGVYATAKTKSGDYLNTIMTEEEIHAIRNRSESYKKYKSGVWVSDFIEMAKKTVIRRAFKTWPRTDDKKLAYAVQLSNDNEGFEPILTAPSVGEYTATQKEFFDNLIQTSDHWGMFVLNKTLDRQTFTNLYHSFEKGQKGKYQKIIDDLLKQGNEGFQMTIADVEAVCSSGDESGLQEIIEEMNQDELQIILNSVSRESVIFINEFKEKE